MAKLLKIVEDVRVVDGVRVKHCDFIWGKTFLDQYGSDENIGRVEKPLPKDCKNECEKSKCTCWTWKKEEDGKSYCHLKDEENCQLLSEDWKFDTVSAVFHDCIDKTKDADGNWQPNIENEIPVEKLKKLNDFRQDEYDKAKKDAFEKMFEEATDLEKAAMIHVRKEDLKSKIKQMEATQHAPVYTPSPADSDINAASNDVASKYRKQDRQFHAILEAAKSKDAKKEDVEATIKRAKELMAPTENLVNFDPLKKNPKKHYSSYSAETVSYQWMKTIDSETNPERRKALLDGYEKWSIGKLSGQTKLKENEVKVTAIREFISAARAMDANPLSKEDVTKMLEKKTKNLTPSQKEILQGVVNTMTNDGSNDKEALKKAREERQSIANNKLTKGSNIVSAIPGKVKSVKKSVKSSLRNMRELSSTGKINALNNAANTANAAYGKMKSGDGLQIASALMDIGSTIAGLAGPAGAPFAAVFGLVNTVIGIFGPKQPSQIEVMTQMINDQTETLTNKIDDQTKILIENFEKNLNALRKNVLNELKQGSWRSMIDEMSGATNTLSLKKKHFLAYANTCISNWNEVALVANIEEITASLGKVASFMQYFCIARDTIPFCGSMLFQYINLINLRNSVQSEAIRIVKASTFHNSKSKLAGLIEEQKGRTKIDKKFMTKTFWPSEDNTDNCFAACSFYNDNPQSFDKNSIGNPNNFGLNPKQKKYVLQYFRQVS